MLKVNLIFCLLVFISCSSNSVKNNKTPYKDYYLKDSNTSTEIKSAIKNGKVIIGMCPMQAFAAAGTPGPYMVIRDKSKWSQSTPPPYIIKAQCKNPDQSVIELMFKNSTQFDSTNPSVFRVKFSKGKAILIDRKNFRE